ncbi:uncharacterized protein LOC106477066 [Limulus polyphemus]|uniref:Uncharacterized protein LOC106477066 n=1 Tax=Limulus polyphemus TaxID=6850 RepID=A0ABM1C2M7_LIMPO|nr:uncharacterized protein LOC106477066 [Limulus polyphemus]
MMWFYVLSYFFLALSLFDVVSLENHGYIEKRALRVRRDDALYNYLQTVLENFRAIMKQGSSNPKIPVLDPLSVRPQNIDESKGSTKISVKLWDILIRGLSDFQIKQLNADINKLKLQIKLNIPKLIATGKYELNGKIINIFPLSGNGNARIEAKDVDVEGEATLGLSSGKLKVLRLDLHLQFHSILVNFENLLGGGNFGDLLNQLISSLGRPLFDKFGPKLVNDLEDGLKESLNKELGKFSLSDILAGKTG